MSGVNRLGESETIPPLFHTKELPLHHTFSIIYSQTLQLPEKEVTEVQLSAKQGRLGEPPPGNPRPGLCGSSVYQDYVTSWSSRRSPCRIRLLLHHEVLPHVGLKTRGRDQAWLIRLGVGLGRCVVGPLHHTHTSLSMYPAMSQVRALYRRG